MYWLITSLEGICLFRASARRLTLSHLRRPLPHIFFLLCIATCFMAFAHESPSLDFLGSAMLGEGAFTFAGMLTSALSFSIVSEHDKYRDKLVIVAILSGIFHIFVVLLGTEEGWYSTAHELGKIGISLNKSAPGPLHDIIAHWFPDYIIFAVIPIFCLGLIVCSPSDDDLFAKRTARTRTLILAGVLAVVAYLLNNVSLWLGLPLSLIAVAFMYFTRKNGEPHRYIRVYVPLGGALITLGVLFAPDLEFMPSNLVSRGYLAQITLPAWPYDMSLRGGLDFLFGRGWGTYDQLLTQNIDLLKVHQYQGDAWDPSWESFMRDQFHAHNVFCETYVSLGVFGLVLGGYSLYILLSNIRKERIYLASFYLFAMTVLFCTWFQVLGTVTFGILMLTRILRDTPVDTVVSRKIPANSWMIIVFLCMAMPVCGGILGLSSYSIRTSYSPKNPETLVVESESFINSGINHLDRLQGYYRINKILSGWLTFGPQIIKNEKARAKDVFYITKLYARKLQEYINGKRMPHSRVLAYNLLALNALHPKLKPFMTSSDYKTWKEFSLTFLDYVPQRATVMCLILSHYLGVGDTASFLQILDKMERISPDNPVALWFRGLHLFNADATVKQGIGLMYQALQKGVNNFIPINPHQRIKIINAHRTMFPHEHMLELG